MSNKLDAQFGTDDVNPRRDDATLALNGERLDDAGTVVLHEERAVASTEKVRAKAVRVRVKVVTEEKTITVPLRREVLEIVEIDGDPQHATNAKGLAKPREIVLHEERVAVETVPYEKVLLRREKIRDEVTVGTDVAREVLEVEGHEGLPGHRS